jgi:hypothetical protein
MPLVFFIDFKRKQNLSWDNELYVYTEFENLITFLPDKKLKLALSVALLDRALASYFWFSFNI